jgi:hypothetical protein
MPVVSQLTDWKIICLAPHDFEQFLSSPLIKVLDRDSCHAR